MVGTAPSEGRREGFLECQRPSFGDHTRFLASIEKSVGKFQIDPLSVEGRGRSVDAIDAGREFGESLSPAKAPALLANGLSLLAENGLEAEVGPMLDLLGSPPECLFIQEKLILPCMLIQVVKLLSFGNQLVVQLLAPSIPLFSNEHVVLFQLLIVATWKLFTSSLQVLELLPLLSKLSFQLSTILLKLRVGIVKFLAIFVSLGFQFLLLGLETFSLFLHPLNLILQPSSSISDLGLLIFLLLQLLFFSCSLLLCSTHLLHGRTDVGL
ncbi:hypothetical protein HG530_004508 [Fusarium avenaceum]|nr:hypothetical protein HG530_004508 [Fusarium avenaceum]